MHTILRVLLLCVLLFSQQQVTVAEENANKENVIKAAIVYKLAMFTRWPETSFKDNQETFGFCVLGKNEFGAALNDLTQQKINSRKIIVEQHNNSLSIGGQCQLVYISSEYSRSFSELYDKPILTVSDSPGFAERKGIIELAKKGSRFTFKINLMAAKRAGVSISSSLLQLSTIVEK